MLISFFIFRVSLCIDLNLAVQDLSSYPFIINGWFVSNKGISTIYSQSIEQCNQNLLKLTPDPSIYHKTYDIPHLEFHQIIIEMDVYFIQYSQSFIRMKIDSKIIFEQTFSSGIFQQQNICGGVDSQQQYTIQQRFYSSQAQIKLEIFYYASSPVSYIGIRNLNIYTNGYKLSNGCTMNEPYLQGTACVQYCSNANPYLGGVDMLVCKSDLIGQSNIIGYYQYSQQDLWKFSDPSPTIIQQQYLTSNYYLINSNLYNNIFHSNLFSSTLNCQQQCYYLTQTIQDTYLLQITFVFYIFGEWNDGSQVGLYIIGDTIYKNNMIKINQSKGKYYSSIGSEIYYTNVTSLSGVNSIARRTLLTFQGKFYSNAVKIGFSQFILGTGSYGFGTIQVYQSYNDPKIALTGLYGIPYQCIPNYYAYNGYCVQECPPYTFQDQNNNNCTDLSYQQTVIFNQVWDINLSKNMIGTYIIKDFYDNNFNQDTINSIFELKPPQYNNYQNGQPFSFIGNKKILGGFNSWGYGAYGIFINLPIHNQIRIYFKLYLIDDWQSGDNFRYGVDSSEVESFSKGHSNQELYLRNTQNQFNDQQIQIAKRIIHTAQELKLTFKCNIQQKNSLTASCGISDLFVLYDQYVDNICNSLDQYYSYFTNNCEQCIGTDCYLYPDYYLSFNPKQYFGCLTRNIASCQTCIQPGYIDLNSDGICDCMTQYVLIQGQCAFCHYSCQTCTDISENSCQSCGSSRQLIGQTCQCFIGYYTIFGQQQCGLIISSCDYTCQTCFGQRYYHCVTCPINSFRTLDQISNTCQCDQYYMDVGTTICQQIICDKTCLTCNGILKSNCISCSTNFRLDNGYCVCDGLFNNMVNSNICQQNNLNCNKILCQDQQILGFMDCDRNLYKYLNIVNNQQQQCDCFDGYYDQQGICIQCDRTCLTCSNTANTCNSCNTSMNRSLNNNQCQCFGGYNDKLAPGQSCFLNYSGCHYSCLDCFGPNQYQCLTCNGHRVLNISSCPCLPSRYDNFVTQSCELCNSTCLTCDGGQINNCLTCDMSLSRILQSNLCNCIAGYNNKLDVYQCEEDMTICQQTCYTCFGIDLNQCLTCPSDRTLQGTTCICKSNYFEQSSICQQCHYTCQTCTNSGSSDCVNCDSLKFREKNNNLCSCLSGYVDVGNPQCQAIHNNYQQLDGAWTQGEFCDDGNNDSRDGCNNNQITYNYSCISIINQPSVCYKCPENCQKCQQQQDQIICISCDQNYYNAQFECIQCHEESCLECVKPSYCSVCMDQKIPISGKCNTCEFGYYQTHQKCLTKCGDGIKTIDEQCDDGNLLSSDGCSELCKIEDNFICETINNNSHCFMHEQPYLLYEIPQQQNNEQKRILISVSQNVTYEDIQIELIEQLNIKQQFVVSGMDNLFINLKLNFNQSYDTITLNLLINGGIVNQQNQSLKSNKLQITLRDIIVLSDQEEYSSYQISSIIQGIVIALFCISTTRLLMGGTSQFVSFLNLIQQLQYIQYVNVNFPPNLIQFLNIFNGFSFAPIFKRFSIQSRLTQVAPQQQMFLYNGLNAYYFANMQGFLFSFILLFLIYILSNLSLYSIEKIKDHFQRKQVLSYNINCKLKKFQRQLFRTQLAIKNDGISQLIFATCYDNQFAIFLQLINQNYDNFNLIINNLFAILNQIVYLQYIGNQIKNEEIVNVRRYGFYQQVKLMAALIFIFAIVYLQSFPQSQVLIISFTSLLVSIFIYTVQPFKNILRNYQLIIQEMALFIASITFTAYVYFPVSVNRIILGWFHIATFTIMILVNIVIELYSFVIHIKKIYFK